MERTAGWRLAAALAASLPASGPATAQVPPIVTDGSLTDPSLGDNGIVEVAPIANPQGGDIYPIPERLGASSGNNVFHSFSRLNVPAGDIARFGARPSTENIIARVTRETSRIDGTLSSTASLFLLNPFGVLFGADATLDVAGSFYASTADLLQFDGVGEPEFPTREGTTPAMLSASSPSAFGFRVDTPAEIVVEGSRLSVPEQHTIMLAGGDVTVRGRASSESPALGAKGGSVLLASAGPGVDIPLDLASFTPGPGPLGSVTLERNAVLDASSLDNGLVGAGRVVIRGGQLVIDDTKVEVKSDRAAAGGTTPDGAPTAIDFEGSGELRVTSGSVLQSFENGDGTAGDIRLVGSDITVSGSETQIFVSGGQPDAAPVTGPAIQIDATRDVTIQGARLTTKADRAGPAGGISIAGDTVNVTAGATVLSEAVATGPGGDLSIAGRSVDISGQSRVAATTQSSPGGSIAVTADHLHVESDSQITTVSTSPTPVLPPPFPSPEGSGRGGSIRLSLTRALRVSDGGQITTRAQAAAGSAPGTPTGPGGDLSVDAPDASLHVSGAGTFVSQVSAVTFSPGAGGDVDVQARSLELTDGGRIRAETEVADGAAGDLQVTVREDIAIRGVSSVPDVEQPDTTSGIFARSLGSGTGGNLTISARSLVLEDKGEVSARTRGQGDAGDLTITATGRVHVRGGPSGFSTISSKGDLGDGGRLSITTDVLEVLDGGQISASTLGSGRSGDLQITTRDALISGVLILDGVLRSESGVFAATTSANVDGGDAGTLRLDASGSLRILEGGRLDVLTRGGGQAGDIEVDAGTLVLASGSQVTSRSIGLPATSGDAGDISITAAGELDVDSASITTTASNAGGGQIRLNGRHVTLFESRVETTVSGSDATENAGNIDIPLDDSAVPLPKTIVINRSVVRANASAANAGNITIRAENLLVTPDSVIEATSERGLDGVIVADNIDPEVVTQVAALPVAYVDVASLLSTPCEVRTARAGSFVVERNEAVDLRDDAPLSAALLGQSSDVAAGGPACSQVEDE